MMNATTVTRKNPATNATVRGAIVRDVPAIHALINYHAERGRMLFRNKSQVYRNLRDFTVFVNDNGEVAGCCGLEVVNAELGEIKSLAVDESQRGRGIGKALLFSQYEQAKLLGLSRIFVLTREPEFFGKMGFTKVDKSCLPEKVWTDCVQCPVQENCDEVAMIHELESADNENDRTH
jgi:amino-acid N-acetyltransferase